MKFLFTSEFPIITYGLGKALQEAGEEVSWLDFSSRYERNPEFLPHLILSHQPDYVVSEGGWYKFWDDLVKTLQALHIPHIYWAREDPEFFESLSLPYSRNCQHVFTTAADCLELYARQGITAHLLMFACLPSFHHKVEPVAKYNHDLIFIGTNFARFDAREKGINIILRPLVGSYDIKIYGNEWWLDKNRPFYIEPESYGGSLEYEETRTAYSSGKIVLGIHSVETSATMMSMRTFEILGCGAFYLTQWTPAIENLFENHKHLVWSKSPEETIDLVDYYLQHDNERIKIARQGQAEVYARHTYKQRARDLLKVLK